MRRNKDRHPSWREPEFEDELDLDEEPDGERDSDDGEFEDGDDEWAEEDDWSETWSGRFDPENRKLIIGGAAVLILIIVAVIVVFAIYLRNSTNERKAVEAQMNLENLTEEIPDEAALPEAAGSGRPDGNHRRSPRRRTGPSGLRGCGQ